MATQRERAIGAWWYWGTEKEAAKALDVSQSTFSRALGGRRLTDKEEIALRQGYLGSTPGQKLAMDWGHEYIATKKPGTAHHLKDTGFSGRRFSKAVKQYLADRETIPKAEINWFMTPEGRSPGD